jgi:hypothetical protein
LDLVALAESGQSEVLLWFHSNAENIGVGLERGHFFSAQSQKEPRFSLEFKFF